MVVWCYLVQFEPGEMGSCCQVAYRRLKTIEKFKISAQKVAHRLREVVAVERFQLQRFH